ncbi:1-acyl-sn-glycerol-3-phosphate acyltransferase [Algoriphagus halophytocola]|uniref:1-acyl-sn-glycerol-3-phosphate acyltransferase n=1 Tax=Algoriphagus halophytocola TaxID=2991499 RepID=A0ABY6MK59_9BACT|nr:MULTISPECIES: 1-acyl-sn-glycerol-3-phosphate acyltransferase [unclassified Algoriphagus]UZD24167.1 1-acyl-sn-glycerol-3-phosphate acyltransferase [Algoriphagus sp. TR-M5]WBL41538.1 1-acyl-sn-glycerol-3-phosphate acyltransferase [Algoriphagus sp. TR-M9]
MSQFDSIRPFFDAEANAAIRKIVDDPMMEAMMNFTFPNDTKEHWKDLMVNTYSLRDFQIKFIYPGVQKVLEKSSEGLSTGGFEQLEPNTAYLFISNHRDIILDTSLLNSCLHENGLVLTTSAIGDNLIKLPFLHTLSRLNRNFAIKRGLQGRALLESSLLASSYIHKSLLKENRSVWTAQREGRTKDGNDATQRGVLKMLTLAEGGSNPFDFFEKIKVVPISISYEYDPTDVLKMPELLAKSRDEKYVKSENEDFMNLLRGIMGTKKHIHLQVNGVLDKEVKAINATDQNLSEKLENLAAVIDRKIWQGYKLWPSNYIAHDTLSASNTYSAHYTEEEKAAFLQRMQQKIESKNEFLTQSFLSMYANPVNNFEKSRGSA